MDDARLFKSMPRFQVHRDPFAAVAWSLPTSGSAGAWMPDVSPLVPFKSGYHLHAARDLIHHYLCAGPRVWLAEARGASVPGGPGRLVVVCESARLVRELDWSLPTRLRLATTTVREALSREGFVEACLHEALAAAEAIEEPTAEGLRAIDARLLQPTFPKSLTHWEEEIEDGLPCASAITGSQRGAGRVT